MNRNKKTTNENEKNQKVVEEQYNKSISTKRYSKFQKFLDKYGENEGNSKNKTRSTDKKSKKTRTDKLYEQAKIKNIYIEKVQKEQKTNKLSKEIAKCTFAPKINKKSKMIASNSKLNQSSDIYERNLDWEIQKNEKIQKSRKTKIEKKIQYSYKPQVRKSDLSDVFSPKVSVKNNLSTLLFLERQEKARANKDYKTHFYNGINYQYKTKYRSLSTEVTRFSKNLTNSVMSQCKAALHDELFETEDIEGIDDMDTFE